MKLKVMLTKWGRSNFSRYNPECNHQCAFGICGADDKKCRNRWNPFVCGKCWRASNYKPTEAPKAAKNTVRVMLDPGAIAPVRAHPADAGLDLHSTEDYNLFPGTSHSFDTGVHVGIPAGFVGLLTSKSGMMLHNECTSRGTIDSGYTGSIRVVLFNHGRNVVQIKAGQKISQLVILPIITPEIELVDSLDDTERGSGGFGSTGAF